MANRTTGDAGSRDRDNFETGNRGGAGDVGRGGTGDLGGGSGRGIGRSEELDRLDRDLDEDIETPGGDRGGRGDRGRNR